MRLYCAAAALLLTACGTELEPPLVATGVVVTAPPPGMTMSAAYLSLTNNSDQSINITHISSAQYGSVQLHETTLDDGVARMRALPALEIPAGDTVKLQRGGKHLMLLRPVGNDNSVSLQFFDNDSLLLSVDAVVGHEIQ